MGSQADQARGADCKSCVFWERQGDHDIGNCHRYPPLVAQHELVNLLSLLVWYTYGKQLTETDRRDFDEWENVGPPQWPETESDNWCGEWKGYEERGHGLEK